MLEQLQMLSVEQQAVIAVATIFALIILFKAIKTIFKVVLIVAIVGLGYYFFNQFAPSGLEKAAKKLEIKAKKVVEDVKEDVRNELSN